MHWAISNPVVLCFPRVQVPEGRGDAAGADSEGGGRHGQPAATEEDTHTEDRVSAAAEGCITSVWPDSFSVMG